MLDESKKNEIKRFVKEWVKRKFNELSKLDPSELHPNPFLLRALGIKENTKEAFEFGIRQRIERSLVTSFGQSVFETMLKILGFEKSKIEDIDLIFEKEGTKYFIQLKSGPEGFTRPALSKTKQTFEKIKSTHPDCKTVIAFGYGVAQRLSPIWGREAKESADLLLIGKDFWDFFLGEGTYEELLKIFEEAGNEVVKETGEKEGLYITLVRKLLEKVKNLLQLEEI